MVDGRVLTQQPAAALSAGDFEQVPLIIGNDERDGAYLGAPVPDDIQQQYITRGFATASTAAETATGDALLSCPARRLARRLAPFVPVFLYSVRRSAAWEPIPFDLDAGIGVDELWL